MTVRVGSGTVLCMTDTGPAGVLRSGWWAPGLALAERGATPMTEQLTQQLTADPPASVRDRVTRWRSAYGTGTRFAERLAADGLDERALLALLAEPATSVAERVAKPAWADTVERAVLAARRREFHTPDWRTAFALPLRPFVANAAADLTDRVSALAGIADLTAIVDAFTVRLSDQLLHLATRTLVHELNTSVAAGRAGGPTDFAIQLTEPAGLGALCTTYPVLARLLGQASTYQTDATEELLTRFAADRATVVRELLDGVDPGLLTEVRTGLGDTHRHGRSVAVLTFADGSKVVYKPRDLGTHARFGAAVDWFNSLEPDLALRTAAVVNGSVNDGSDDNSGDGHGYGWVEFVPARPLPDAAAADRFYRRQGALLALLHALHAADMHFENVIACGDQPVLVDVETLFHPSLAVAADAVDPAARVLSDSVRRTGLLPTMVVDEHGATDVSGLGGGTVTDVVADWRPDDRGGLRPASRPVTRGGGNLPTRAGVDIDVTGHEKALLSGFRQGYDALLRHRGELVELLTSCAADEVRVAVRNSRGYVTMLVESTRPELLRDALVRDRALDVLWRESAQHPLRWQACRHELADLWAMDVPLFTARPGAADLWSANGERLPDVLAQPALTTALAKVEAMSEVDRRDQEWIIAAALATRAPSGGHRSVRALPGHLAGIAAPPERLLVSACALADRIVASHLSEADRVNWLGLELVDDRQWLVLPMGASLGTGYLGVALFLAQVTELSGIARYADMARRALHGLPRMFELVATRPDLVPVIGCGGFDGFGGIAYALARLTTLLGDDRLRSATGTAVDLAATAAKSTSPAGVASGTAGCLAAMTAVHAELGLEPAAALARDCADRLAALVRDTGGRCGDAAGFLLGSAGIAWALTPHDPHAADLALAHARAADGDLGWCTGTAGVLMAGGTVESAAALSADRPVLDDLSLCHGELGIAEALTVLATTGDRTRAEPVASVRKRRAGLLLDAFTQHGASCGTPGGVPTPGLLTGLAGIGYGLLRLGFEQQVPSVLLLEPSRPHTNTTKGPGTRV